MMGPACLKGIFMLVVFLALVQEGFCCTCLRQRNEEKFCTANIAMRAMVQDAGTIVGNNKIYRIMPYRLYKSTVPTRNVNLFQVVTGTNSAACGVNLRPGRQYFFTGYVEEAPRRFRWYRARRRIRVSLCGWVQNFYTLTLRQRRFISNPYSCSRSHSVRQ